MTIYKSCPRCGKFVDELFVNWHIEVEDKIFDGYVNGKAIYHFIKIENIPKKSKGIHKREDTFNPFRSR